MFMTHSPFLSTRRCYLNRRGDIANSSILPNDRQLSLQHPIGQRFGVELEIASWADFGLGALFKASDNYQLSHTVSYLTPQHSGFQERGQWNSSKAAASTPGFWGHRCR